MEIRNHSSMDAAVGFLKETVKRNPAMDKALAGMELSVGPASHPSFAVDGGALQSPMMVGDSRLIGDAIAPSAALEAQMKANPDSVRVLPKYNERTGKFDMHLVDAKRPYIGDAAPDLIAGQLLSPNGINAFTQVFKKPLIKSAARKLVSPQAGSNPWAEVMTMYLADFAGFAALPTAGAVNNTMSQDVEVISGLMSSPVINMEVSYRISVEEQNRANASGSSVPYAGQLIAAKQQYADWALDLLTDSQIYFGNSATGTIGLLTAGSGVTAWSGNSLKVINAGASTTKGSDMAAGLAQVIADFLTANQNMLSKVKIAMSPYAHNLLSKTFYSANYNPTSAIKILLDNFMAGEDTDGRLPDLEIMADPLLAPNTIFNANNYDLMVISSPEIGGGPGYESQPVVGCGLPLDKFVYPVVPGMYGTPYKTLRRYAGLFVPYTPAIAAYSGFGTSTGV